MIDKYHNKSIRSTDRVKGVSEFVFFIRWVEQEKEPIFITGYEEKDRVAKIFNKLKHPLQLKMLKFFSD